MNWNLMGLRGAVALLVAFSLGILGCASSDDVPVRPIIQDADLIGVNHNAADALLARAPWLKERHEPLLANGMSRCWRPLSWTSTILRCPLAWGV